MNTTRLKTISSRCQSLYRISPLFISLLFFAGCASLPDMNMPSIPSVSDIVVRGLGGNEGNGANSGLPGEVTPAPPDNNITLPNEYAFSYLATLRVENSTGAVEPVFYLQPGADYYAQKKVLGELTEYLVYDNSNNLAVYFAERGGLKRRSHGKINLETKATLMGAYRGAPEVDPIQSLGSKSILGFNSNGYRITTVAGTTELWITDEAPASPFSSMFANLASHSQSTIPMNDATMVMEVRFASAQSPDDSYHMICTGIEPEALLLETSDYVSPDSFLPRS